MINLPEWQLLQFSKHFLKCPISSMHIFFFRKRILKISKLKWISHTVLLVYSTKKISSEIPYTVPFHFLFVVLKGVHFHHIRQKPGFFLQLNLFSCDVNLSPSAQLCAILKSARLNSVYYDGLNQTVRYRLQTSKMNFLCYSCIQRG